MFPFYCVVPLLKRKSSLITEPRGSKPLSDGDSLRREVDKRKIPSFKDSRRGFSAYFSTSILVIPFEDFSEFVKFLLRQPGNRNMLENYENIFGLIANLK